jgi:hypothetical protein
MSSMYHNNDGVTNFTRELISKFENSRNQMTMKAVWVVEKAPQTSSKTNSDNNLVFLYLDHVPLQW